MFSQELADRIKLKSEREIPVKTDNLQYGDHIKNIRGTAGKK